jgi:glycolate dehydrogenase FAD-binding subunit
MALTADVATRLAQTIGATHVVAAPEELPAYAVDGAVPSAIVRPASAEQVAQVVRLALSDKLAILPVGSRSKCEIGMPPSRLCIVMDMTGLRDVAHYDAGDLTLSIDAGMPLRELAIFLKEHGQFLPLAVPCFESTTAGGAIASGIDSALRLQYGSARDILIGAEFVDGTGQLCRSGGRVVKNVTGYDLHKLLIGSQGTLGVITRLNFRTFPLPSARGGHVASFAKCDGALAFRKNVEKAGLPLANLEVLSSLVMRRIAAVNDASVEPPVAISNAKWCVSAAYEGTEAVVRRISGDLERAAREAGALQSEFLNAAASERLKAVLREAFDWLRWLSPATVVCRLALPEVKPEILSELSRLAESASLPSAILLRAAGVVYWAVFADGADDSAIATLTKVITSSRSVAAAHQGDSTVLHAPLPVKTRLAANPAGGQNVALSQRVKQAFDPAGVFAPGRTVGGL